MRRFFTRSFSVSAVLLLCWVTVSSALAADCADRTPVVLEKDSLRVLTLNVAHGRKDGKNQMLLSGETIRSNLVELGQLLDKAEADVVALQEADAEYRTQSCTIMNVNAAKVLTCEIKVL